MDGAVFEAKVGTRYVEGIDILRLDAHGLVDDFRVMVRPHSALEALMTAMVPMNRARAGGPGQVDELTAPTPP